ncbi:MAG: DUF692 domain-containing protein [Rubrivivax sp.]|nr:DUF692 domain-containing protein [Rubrivivax sp.]
MIQAGFGLKAAHLRELLAREPASLVAGAAFFEVHAENYMVAGGPLLRHLQAVRERWPLSIHGVGLSIGGEGPLDAAHLARLAGLVERFEPRWFSEHLAWSSHGGRWFNDLLPLPYDRATLQRVCDHVQQVQERLKRTLLLENPSTYVEFATSTMDEGAFLAEVVRRTGCGLLLDVNNAYVSAVNHGRDPWALIAALPAAAVGEIHLAGFAEDRDAAGDRLLIDHHGAPVDAAVWSLYERTVAHLLPLAGPVPTLIERDNDVPPMARLEAEALEAAACQRRLMQQQCEPHRRRVRAAGEAPRLAA